MLSVASQNYLVCLLWIRNFDCEIGTRPDAPFLTGVQVPATYKPNLITNLYTNHFGLIEKIYFCHVLIENLSKIKVRMPNWGAFWLGMVPGDSRFSWKSREQSGSYGQETKKWKNPTFIGPERKKSVPNGPRSCRNGKKWRNTGLFVGSFALPRWFLPFSDLKDQSITLRGSETYWRLQSGLSERKGHSLGVQSQFGIKFASKTSCSKGKCEFSNTLMSPAIAPESKTCWWPPTSWCAGIRRFFFVICQGNSRNIKNTNCKRSFHFYFHHKMPRDPKLWLGAGKWSRAQLHWQGHLFPLPRMRHPSDFGFLDLQGDSFCHVKLILELHARFKVWFDPPN